jgi:predicted ester cyclase
VGGPVSTPGNRRPLLPRADRTTTGENTHAEQAKALIRRWFGEAMNSGSSATARAVSAEVFAEGFVDHDGPGGTRDRAHWQSAVVDAVFAAFSDVEVRIEHLPAENDLVAVRYVFSGRHTGPFRGRAATGRRIRHTENEIYRIADGQITESWGEGDWLGTFRQLDSPTTAEDEGRS